MSEIEKFREYRIKELKKWNSFIISLWELWEIICWEWIIECNVDKGIDLKVWFKEKGKRKERII